MVRTAPLHTSSRVNRPEPLLELDVLRALSFERIASQPFYHVGSGRSTEPKARRSPRVRSNPAPNAIPQALPISSSLVCLAVATGFCPRGS